MFSNLCANIYSNKIICYFSYTYMRFWFFGPHTKACTSLQINTPSLKHSLLILFWFQKLKESEISGHSTHEWCVMFTYKSVCVFLFDHLFCNFGNHFFSKFLVRPFTIFVYWKEINFVIRLSNNLFVFLWVHHKIL